MFRYQIGDAGSRENGNAPINLNAEFSITINLCFTAWEFSFVKTIFCKSQKRLINVINDLLKIRK